MSIYCCPGMCCSSTVGMTARTDELLLNTRVCVYTHHHHRWYFCSESRFLLPISHLGCSTRMYTSLSEFKTVIFSVLTEHRGAKRETWESAHYASLTPEVKDRKQAGGQCVKLEQRCLSVGKNKMWFLWAMFLKIISYWDKVYCTLMIETHR